jgi:hypothetical protein
LRIALFIIVMLVGSVVSHADEPQSPNAENTTATPGEHKEVTREQVNELLAQLDSRKLTARRNAERDLVVLGPGILPFLPAPELLKSIQVKQAVRRLRITLEHAQARESIKASRISKTGTLPLKEIALLIEKQSQNQLLVPKNIQNNPFSVDWQKRSFWGSINDLEKQSLKTVFNAQSGRFEFAAGKVNHVAVWQKEAFRATLSPLTIKAAGDEQLIRCELNLTTEPRLRPLLLRYKSADWSMSSSDRTAISNFNPSARFEIPLGESGREAKLQLNFLRPKPKPDPNNGNQKPTRLNLSGHATLLTAAREQPIRFTRLNATGVVRRRAGVSVNLQSVKEHQKDAVRHIRVQAQVSYDIGRNAFESHQTWIFHNRVYLETKSGNAIALNDGFETLFHADGSVGVVYRFKNVTQDLADLRFVYVAPTLLINVPLDIQFSDLKL